MKTPVTLALPQMETLDSVLDTMVLTSSKTVHLKDTDRIFSQKNPLLDPFMPKITNTYHWEHFMNLQFGTIPKHLVSEEFLKNPYNCVAQSSSATTLGNHVTPHLAMENIKIDNPPSPVSASSFATAPSSLDSEELDHMMNFDSLALDSISSSVNSSEIETEFYSHEVKKSIYKKRAAMRMHDEGPRRKKWCSTVERELQVAREEEHGATKRVMLGQGMVDTRLMGSNLAQSPWKKLKFQLKYEGKGKLRYGLSKEDDLWEKFWAEEEEVESKLSPITINIMKPGGAAGPGQPPVVK